VDIAVPGRPAKMNGMNRTARKIWETEYLIDSIFSPKHGYTGWYSDNCLYIAGFIITICIRNLRYKEEYTYISFRKEWSLPIARKVALPKVHLSNRYAQKCRKVH
jgi:hypothetical protein